jgi:hypothetical protein
METLKDIATAYGVSIQTVHNWKTSAESHAGAAIEGQPHPTDGRKVVYTAQQVAAIVGDRRPLAAQQAAAQVTVETGNHCSQLAAPQVAGAFSLEQFRADDVTALTFEDPGAVADQFLAVADQLLAGMDADVKARQQRLDATKAAQAKVASKAQELSLEARLYRLQAGQLDTAQTAETQALQDAVAALQSMGKAPTAAGDASPGA